MFGTFGNIKYLAPLLVENVCPMKNVILSLAIASVLLNGSAASAQILTQSGVRDTVTGCYTGGSEVTVYNPIKSASANNVVLRWNVIPGTAKFDPGWDVTYSGVCDNYNCYSGPATIVNGSQWVSNTYDNTGFTGLAHDFHVIFAVNTSGTLPALGSSASVRVNAYDTVGKTTRTLTFIGQICATGINTISSSDDVVLFPNPAREAINVIYDEKAGVKTIAVYNLIGKLMGPVYKPSSNGSAKIDLDEMPTGIYFLRLMNNQGKVVATRRFTRQ